jgi:hypothetical protein
MPHLVKMRHSPGLTVSSKLQGHMVLDMVRTEFNEMILPTDAESTQLVDTGSVK